MVELLADGISTGTVFAHRSIHSPYHDCAIMVRAEIEATGAVRFSTRKHMYAGSKYESHYTVWTAWISIRVRVRVRVYFILQNLAPLALPYMCPQPKFCERDRRYVN